MFKQFLTIQKIDELSFQNLIDFSFYHLNEPGLIIRYDDEGNLLFAKVKGNTNPTPNTWISHKFALHEGFDWKLENNEYKEISNLTTILSFIDNIPNVIIQKQNNQYIVKSNNIEVQSPQLLETMLRLKLKLIYGETLLFPKIRLNDEEWKQFACFQIYPIFGNCETYKEQEDV